MHGIRRVSYAFRGWLVLAAAFVASPAFAQACQQWDMTGRWTLIQSNDTAVNITLAPAANGYTGQAWFGRWEKDDFWGCSIAACGEDYVSFSGPGVGTLNGNTFELKVYWSDNKIGVYSGQIGPQGLIVGTTFDQNDPRTSAQWHSDRVAKCLSTAPVAPAKPTMVLGRVQSTTPPDPNKTMCDYAKSARERNSPAAPALERRCNEYLAAHPATAAAAAPTVAFARIPHVSAAAPVMTVCEYAQSARARNSPAAPGLQKQCNEYLAAHPEASPPAAAPASPPAAGNSAPVTAPNDLLIGRITYTQGGRPVSQPIAGKPVGVACNYTVNASESPFVFSVQPWQGLIVIGGGAPQTLNFRGDPRAGQHEARQIWTPTATGRTPISCVLNQGFENAEANGGNNRWNELIEVVAGDEIPPAAADDAAAPAQ